MSAPWLEGAYARFSDALGRGELAHAWLVSGPAGLGKRELVERMLAATLCARRLPGGDACGECRPCELRQAGSNPDLHRIGLELNDRGTARSEIVIDQIRTLCEKLLQTSHGGARRIAVIDPADALNTSSVNALLKTLEEPPPAVVIVLIADQPSRLPATLRSRCQRLDVRVPDHAQSLAWLLERGIAGAVAERAMLLSAGHPGEARHFASRQALVDGVLDDLIAMRDGASASDVARRWLADYGLPDALDIAAQVLRIGFSVGASEARAGRAMDPRIRRLTEGLERVQFSEQFERLGVLRARLGAPLRHELLLTGWLRNWSPARASPRRTHIEGKA